MKPFTVVLLAISISLTQFPAGCSKPTTEQRYEKLMKTYLDAWNGGDLKQLDNVVDQDFELRMSPLYEPEIGIDSLKSTIRYWRNAYPDFHIRVEEIIYAENAVTVRWVIDGTNNGPGRNPPTGKTVEVPGISIMHINANKISDEWIASNNLLWLRQLGFTLLPPS